MGRAYNPAGLPRNRIDPFIYLLDFNPFIYLFN